MIRTATEIERALEIVISNYNVTNGSVYSNGARPSNSTYRIPLYSPANDRMVKQTTNAVTNIPHESQFICYSREEHANE